MSRTLSEPSAADPIYVKTYFKRAAEWILREFDLLSVGLETARALNHVIERGFIDPRWAPFLGDRDRLHALKDWFESEEFHRLEEGAPIALGEAVHGKIIEIHPFNEGNGRTALLMADLVLLRAGLPPAAHFDRSMYFARASLFPRRKEAGPLPSQEERITYFREMVDRARELLSKPERRSPSR